MDILLRAYQAGDKYTGDRKDHIDARIRNVRRVDVISAEEADPYAA